MNYSLLLVTNGLNILILFKKTPGPGAHTKMLQYPMPKHIREVGRYHGVFFPPGVY